MSNDKSNLPHWDMSVLYPGLNSAEFEQGFQAAIQSVEELAALFDQHHITRQAPLTVDAEVVTLFEEVIGPYDTVDSEVHTLRVYIRSFVHTDF